MSPSEKAQELIEKFKEFAPFKPYTDKEGTWLYKASEELNAAKQCAAICVQEILKDKMVLGGDYKFDEFKSAKFWEQVLSAINNK